MSVDKTALVTGAQQGIGRAAASELAQAGFDVAVNYLDDEGAAREVAREVESHGRRALLLRGDVSSVIDIDVMVSTVDRQWGRLDALVNNAGIFPRVPFLDLTEKTWDEVLDVNLKSTAFASQAAARLMIRDGRGGVIINLTSSAVRGQMHGAHYAASKGGIVALTRSLAIELADHGIRVNAIAPGLTDTAQPRAVHDDAGMASISATIPLGRVGSPAEMGRMIALLASAEFGYVTGQVLHVNGGSYMP